MLDIVFPIYHNVSIVQHRRCALRKLRHRACHGIRLTDEAQCGYLPSEPAKRKKFNRLKQQALRNDCRAFPRACGQYSVPLWYVPIAVYSTILIMTCVGRFFVCQQAMGKTHKWMEEPLILIIQLHLLQFQIIHQGYKYQFLKPFLFQVYYYSELQVYLKSGKLQHCRHHSFYKLPHRNSYHSL